MNKKHDVQSYVGKSMRGVKVLSVGEPVTYICAGEPKAKQTLNIRCEKCGHEYHINFDSFVRTNTPCTCPACSHPHPKDYIGKTLWGVEFLREADPIKISYPSKTVSFECVVGRCVTCGEEKTYKLKTIVNATRPLCKKCYPPLRAAEQDLSGQRFHDLKVLDRYGSWLGKSATLWRVQCALCGRVSIIDGAHLGYTKACTCQRAKTLKEGRATRDLLLADGSCVSSVTPDRALNSNNKTGHTGVCAHVKKKKDGTTQTRYRAYIVFRRKQYGLGEYVHIEDAISARERGEKEIFGNFLDWYAAEYPDLWARFKHKSNPT